MIRFNKNLANIFTTLHICQIPRTMNKEELLPMFREFGEVYNLSIIKHRVTNEHAGCAFLTFFTRAAAERAITALHDKRVLPGVNNTIQYNLIYYIIHCGTTPKWLARALHRWKTQCKSSLHTASSNANYSWGWSHTHAPLPRLSPSFYGSARSWNWTYWSEDQKFWTKDVHSSSTSTNTKRLKLSRNFMENMSSRWE